MEGNGEINFSKYMSKQFLENLQDYVRETVDDRDKKYEIRMHRMGDKNIAKRKEHEGKIAFLNDRIHKLEVENGQLKKNQKSRAP